MNLAPVHTAEDLYQCWRVLMGPLGFSRRSLWLGFIDEDGRMNPALTQIEDVPEGTTVEMCFPLVEMCRHALGDSEGRTVAILLTRPGRHPMNSDDRSWARSLLMAAAELGVAMHPVHFANDNTLLVFAADDLLPIG